MLLFFPPNSSSLPPKVPVFLAVSLLFYPASASRSLGGAADVLVVLFVFTVEHCFSHNGCGKPILETKEEAFFAFRPETLFPPKGIYEGKEEEATNQKNFFTLLPPPPTAICLSPLPPSSPTPKLGLLGKGTPAHCCTKENGEKMDCRPCCCCIWDKNVLALCS